MTKKIFFTDASLQPLDFLTRGEGGSTQGSGSIRQTDKKRRRDIRWVSVTGTTGNWQHHKKRQEKDGVHQGGLKRHRYQFKLLATSEETGKGWGTSGSSKRDR
jgi:hypothetical protein